MIDNRISSGTATPTTYCASHIHLEWIRVNTNVIQTNLFLEVTGISGSQDAIIATGFPKPRLGLDTPRFLTWWGVGSATKNTIIVYIDRQGNLHAARDEAAGSGNVALTASFYYI